MKKTWKIMNEIIDKNTKYKILRTQKIIINKEEVTG